MNRKATREHFLGEELTQRLLQLSNMMFEDCCLLLPVMMMMMTMTMTTTTTMMMTTMTMTLMGLY
jgi:uncharacterized membrane protein